MLGDPPLYRIVQAPVAGVVHVAVTAVGLDLKVFWTEPVKLDREDGDAARRRRRRLGRGRRERGGSAAAAGDQEGHGQDRWQGEETRRGHRVLLR